MFLSGQALADCEQVLNEQDNKEASGNPSKEATELAKSFKATFKSSMADDLHTPVVVAAFSDPLKFMNNLLHTRKVHTLPIFRNFSILDICKIVRTPFAHLLIFVIYVSLVL